MLALGRRAGGFPDVSDTYGRTPALYCCVHGDAAALHLLLRAGASAASRPWDRACLPLLFWACHFETPACMALLARYGAIPLYSAGPSQRGRAFSLMSFYEPFCADTWAGLGEPSVECRDMAACVQREWYEAVRPRRR